MIDPEPQTAAGCTRSTSRPLAPYLLTHRPEDARPAEGITIFNCPVDEAVRIGLEAAQGKNLEVFSPSIGEQGSTLAVNLGYRPIPTTAGGGPGTRHHGGAR